MSYFTSLSQVGNVTLLSWRGKSVDDNVCTIHRKPDYMEVNNLLLCFPQKKQAWRVKRENCTDVGSLRISNISGDSDALL